MFSVNFYVSCFDIIRNSIGKKLIRLDWEEAVYWPLFKLTTSLNELGEVASNLFPVNLETSY